jgi:hypothetical protein
MRELRAVFERKNAGLFTGANDGVEGDFPQGHDDAHLSQKPELLDEIMPAGH